MSSSIRRRLVLGSLAAAGSAASWPLIQSAHAQRKPEFTMVFAHTFTRTTENYVVTGIDRFKQLAEKYSGGRLLVDVHEGGALGGQNILPQKVQQGAIQAAQQSMQNLTPYSEAYNALDFPFLFPTNAAFEKFLDHPFFSRSVLATEPESKGLKVLPGMWTNSGFRVLGISKKVNREVRLPSDLKGLKVRVTASKVELQSFAMTPGKPVSVNWAETYQALQQGVVDACHVGIGPLSAVRIPETLGTATRLDMSLNPHITVVSKKWFDGLPESVRGAITRAAAESWAYQKAEQRKADERMWTEWRSAGIKIVELTPDQRKQWIGVNGHQRPEWKEAKERYGQKLYEQIAALIPQLA